MIEALRKEGCQVLATSRKYRETESVARMRGLRLEYFGSRGGKDLRDQLVEATNRQGALIPVVSEFKPDLSISAGSAVCARVSFGLRVRHIAVNDSPHSTVAGSLSLPLSYHLLCPWIIPYGDWSRYGIKRDQVTKYRALDPAAWLKRESKAFPVPRLNSRHQTVTVRLEESYAPYMSGTDESWNETVLRAIGDALPSCNLVALCRYGDQLDRVESEFGSRYIVPRDVIDGRSMLNHTDLFVGMGGTMTAEASLMGVPTVSAFQGSLRTEEYLVSVDLLTKAKSPGQIVSAAKRLLAGRAGAQRKSRAKAVLDSMEDPAEKVTEFILKALS